MTEAFLRYSTLCKQPSAWAASPLLEGGKMNKPKIRFINPLGQTLFYVNDGGEIEIDIDGGGTQRHTCRYIDDYHAWIGSRVYHIREFAEMMERNNRTYRPVETQPV
jgi:hypothetical protein